MYNRLGGWNSGVCFHELTLGYCDGIIGQYWLELHEDKVEYYEK
jgi:hypothetical protein